MGRWEQRHERAPGSLQRVGSIRFGLVSGSLRFMPVPVCAVRGSCGSFDFPIRAVRGSCGSVLSVRFGRGASLSLGNKRLNAMSEVFLDK